MNITIILRGAVGERIANAMCNNDEDILFEDMSAKWKSTALNKPPKEKYRPKPIKGKYDTTYDEIINKCHPRLFMADYDYDKVRIANEIYTSAKAWKGNKEKEKQLRKRAQAELGITFSTERLFDKLTDCLHPGLYVDKPNFDYANKLYNQVLINADNIDALEEIMDKILAEREYNKLDVSFANKPKLKEEKAAPKEEKQHQDRTTSNPSKNKRIAKQNKIAIIATCIITLLIVSLMIIDYINNYEYI